MKKEYNRNEDKISTQPKSIMLKYNRRLMVLKSFHCLMKTIDQDKLKEAYEYVLNAFEKLDGVTSLEGGKVNDS